MPYTIITDICEGFGDCVDGCPIAYIYPGSGKNALGIDEWNWIDFASCIDCGICLQVCPVEGAIIPEERPDLQKKSTRLNKTRSRKASRSTTGGNAIVACSINAAFF